MPEAIQDEISSPSLDDLRVEAYESLRRRATRQLEVAQRWRRRVAVLHAVVLAGAAVALATATASIVTTGASRAGAVTLGTIAVSVALLSATTASLALRRRHLDGTQRARVAQEVSNALLARARSAQRAAAKAHALHERPTGGNDPAADA